MMLEQVHVHVLLVENGILAKRIEILARYQDSYCQKYGKCEVCFLCD